MAAVVLSFVVACIVLWAGVGTWLGKGRARLDVLAWIGLVSVPLFAGYVAVRSAVTTLGIVVSVAAWLGFGALLVWVRRRRARRAAAAGGTPTPS